MDEMERQKQLHQSLGAPNGYSDTQSRADQAAENKKIQKQFNQLCGPVTVRKKGEDNG